MTEQDFRGGMQSNMRGEGRVPPHSKEAELAVIGSVILNPESYKIARQFIGPEDFYLEFNRKVFGAIETLVSRGDPIDSLLLGEELLRKGNDFESAGLLELSKVTDNVPTTALIDRYAEVVREKSVVRNLIWKGQELVANAYERGSFEGVEEALGELQKVTRRIHTIRMPDTLFKFGQGVLDLYDKIQKGYTGIELPWPTLNKMTMGMWPGTITIFVARPGVGKTFVATIIARHAWKNKERVLLVSPEMSKQEIAERFFVIEADVSYQDLIAGTVSDVALPQLIKTVDQLREEDGIWILDGEDDLSPRGMEAAIHSCEPALIGIDSMYDLKFKGERRDRIIAGVDWLRGICKERKIAGCGFAQQNRGAELDEKKGGGSRLGTIALADEIGQDAHAIFALEQDKDMKKDRRLKFKPLKLRRGFAKQDKVESNWDFDRMNYAEIIRGDDIGDPDGEEIPF